MRTKSIILTLSDFANAKYPYGQLCRHEYTAFLFNVGIKYLYGQLYRCFEFVHSNNPIAIRFNCRRYLKKIRNVIALLFIVFNVHSQSHKWIADSANSIIKFTTSGPFGEVGGNLYGLKGEIEFDEKHPDSGSFYVTVRAASVKTGLSMRDDHLQGEDFFNTDVYPVISFKSKKVRKGASGGYVVTGDLIIKNIAKQIDIPFTFEHTNRGAIFNGIFTIDCYDYSVGSSSKNVKILLQVPATPVNW